MTFSPSFAESAASAAALAANPPSAKACLAAGTTLLAAAYANFAINSTICSWLSLIPYIGWLLALLNAILSIAMFVLSAPIVAQRVATYVDSGKADEHLNAAIAKVRSIFKR